MSVVQSYPARPYCVPAPALSHPNFVVEKHSEVDYALEMSDVRTRSKRRKDEERKGRKQHKEEEREEKDTLDGLYKR